MKIVKLFEEFLNELEFKDKAEYAEYLKTHKVRKGTKITFVADTDEPEKEVDMKEMTVYHTSGVPLKKLSSRPMWFTKSKELAKAYDFNNIESGGGTEAFTYEIKVKGKILGMEEVASFAEEAGIDQEEKVTELTENPGPEDVKKLIKPYMSVCDGFDHWDYDPRDWGDAESTIIFNPAKSCTIVKRIKFNHEEE
jgi:hypothetical protein